MNFNESIKFNRIVKFGKQQSIGYQKSTSHNLVKNIYSLEYIPKVYFGVLKQIWEKICRKRRSVRSSKRPAFEASFAQ